MMGKFLGGMIAVLIAIKINGAPPHGEAAPFFRP